MTGKRRDPIYPMGEQEVFAQHLLAITTEYAGFCKNHDATPSWTGFMLWLATAYQVSAYREQEYLTLTTTQQEIPYEQ